MESLQRVGTAVVAQLRTSYFSLCMGHGASVRRELRKVERSPKTALCSGYLLF